MQKNEYQKIEEMENRHFWYMAMEEHTLQMIKNRVKREIKILDAGCGSGGFAEKLGRLGPVFAIDINPEAIRHARKKNISKVIKASVTKLPFRDESFDAVVCLDVLYHKKVKNDVLALREIYRVLKNGGLFFLRLPALEILRGSHDIVVETRHRYTVREVRQKLNFAGFNLQKLSYANMFLSLPLLMKRSYERLFSKKTGAKSDSRLIWGLFNSFFYFILKFELGLTKKFDLPFGSSVIAIAKKN